MGNRFYESMFTPNVKALQEEHGSRRQYARMEQAGGRLDGLGRDERAFIGERDSFYIASVSETGWPYVQHRGGPTGFLRVLEPSLLGFADLRGNKQYISVGNFGHDPRVTLFLMDYPNQTRLKIIGRVEVHENDAAAAELMRSLRSDKASVVERAILIHVEGFDWNCPQHITPRYTVEQIEEGMGPLRERMASLEVENAALRAQVAGRRSV